MSINWITRAEISADIPTIRDISLAAFDTPLEADLVDALRADPSWINGLSIVMRRPRRQTHRPRAADPLPQRRHPGPVPRPVSVWPEYQKTGAGSAAIRVSLQAAKELGERFVTVLGHPTHYPRFGFTRASKHGIGLSIDVPDEAMTALTLDAEHPLPSSTVHYAAPFGIQSEPAVPGRQRTPARRFPPAPPHSAPVIQLIASGESAVVELRNGQVHNRLGPATDPDLILDRRPVPFPACSAV